MSWNDTKTLLTKPISNADISFATGTGGPSYVMGNMVKDGTGINPMAKYKAFKYATPGFASKAACDAARPLVRYGFGTSVPQLTLSATYGSCVLTNDWVYDKPTQGKNNEWFRNLDFDGYAPRACTPLALYIGQLAKHAESQIIISANAASNAFRTDGRRWVADQSLSLKELLESPSDLYASYIGFVLVIPQLQRTDVVLIRTGLTYKKLVTDHNGAYTFQLLAEGGTISGKTYPAISSLQYASLGAQVTVIACILSSGAASGYAYEVDTLVTPQTAYSVGFTAGCDRIVGEVVDGGFNLDGTLINSMSVTCTDMTTEQTWNGKTWRAYQVSVRAKFDTRNAAAFTGTQNIYGQLEIDNNESFRFGPSPDAGDNLINVAVTAALQSQTLDANYRTLYTTTNQQYLWVMKEQGSLVPTTVAAVLTLIRPLTAPVSNSANATIS